MHQLRRLVMGGTILHIGAHPDDEDGGMIAYMTRKYHARVVYWSATRGEGSLNRIGTHTGDALGIYRTWESLAAREVDGGEAMFGPFYDFGFCKTGAEALAKWGRARLVEEIVRAIWITKPQIVVSRWIGGPSDGHGHHQAVGEAAIEAVDLAGRPEMFPNLRASGLTPWQPAKTYFSTGGDWQPGERGSFGEENPALEEQGALRINTGAFDASANRTYQEIAWTAINEHRSQAIGFVPNRGDYYYYYILHKSRAAGIETETSFYDGLDPSLAGLADYPGGGSETLRSGLMDFIDQVNEAIRLVRTDARREAADQILEGLVTLRNIRAGLGEEALDDELRRSLGAVLDEKIQDCEQAAILCLGLQLECTANRARITPGEDVEVFARVWDQGRAYSGQTAFSIHVPTAWKAESIRPDPAASTTYPHQAGFKISVPASAEFTRPYWLVESHDRLRYRWPDDDTAGLPFGPAPVRVACEVAIGPHRLTLHETAYRKESFPGGFRELPIVVVPPISLQPRSHQVHLKHRSEEQTLELQVIARCNREVEPVRGKLMLKTPPNWRVEPEAVDLTLNDFGDTETVRFSVRVPPGCAPQDYLLRYVFQTGYRDYDAVLHPVWLGAPGIPLPPDANNCVREEFIIEPASILVQMLDLNITEKLRYGFVRGLEERMTSTLESLGFDFSELSDSDLKFADLSDYDAILIGPNAYLIRDELAKNAARMLDYVAAGGTLIVLSQGYGYQEHRFAPYPFSYNQPHDRVTNEEAPVRILNPQHVLLNQPNQISEADFEGWVHDRGIYFFGSWDKRYQPVISSHDPGEDPKPGGLMLTSYGQGAYLYTGYSFFRQLPAGVRGAFRLFANLLALPNVRIKQRVESLKNVSLFAFMTEDQLAGVARLMTERWEPDGIYLCHQGDWGEELYIITEGEVEIINEKEDQIVSIETAGACIGELAVLESIPRQMAMRTKGDVRLLVLKGSRFQRLIQEHAHISFQVIKLLARRLANTISGIEFE